MTEKFQFTRPQEAPVFRPTEEEFRDPLAYINKIRPIAEAAGICKIKPPKNWQPPFAVDVDSFKFTPRVQRLNELEAKTRIKLNFLDRIAKFWELQGSSLKIPTIEKKAVDLYTLHKLVQGEGGKEKVNNDKKWNRLAVRMGYNPQKCYGVILRSHYEKILYPFDIFEKTNDLLKTGEKQDLDKPKKGSGMKTPVKSSMRMGGKNNKTSTDIEDKNGNSTRVDKAEVKSKELKRLAFYGAGPKMAGYNKQSQSLSLTVTQAQDTKAHSRKLQTVQDPLAKYVCHICNGGDAEEKMLLCDGCDDSYHTFCLQPPLLEVPKGDWRCPQCVAEEVSKPCEAFGFEQAQKEYTLQLFGDMADQFKQDYFNMPANMVPSELVEKEFWRIVSAIDEDVTVEYGADLHTMDHGSGFPTESSSNIEDGDLEYIHSGWNLNNLPVLHGSVLGHINADISGMKVPWMYVGMCFATFCWHNEDHWSYSINYLHWGEPKTWYGVPGSRADDFEVAMKQAAPELFHSQPDLLHQLVTIMNPNILMKAGVPVYRMDQKAGEFIITFPRAYHAGFNQGYNFAEAVNFAPADWLTMGRDCITHYSNLHRYCVFSHDELICKMASAAVDLDIIIALSTYKDMAKMLETEKELRRVVLNWGLTGSERVAFEMLPDDNRLCEFCKTTCFLSAITCPCTKDQLVCLRHYDKLCECESHNHILKYRYTLDELPELIYKLQDRTSKYESWAVKVKNSLISENKSTQDKKDDFKERKMHLEELKDLAEEAKKNNYPNCQLVETVKQVATEAEKLSKVAKMLLSSNMRTRKSSNAPSKPAYTVSELKVLIGDLKKLPVKLREEQQIETLVSKLQDFNVMAKYYIDEQHKDKYSAEEMKSFIDDVMKLDVELPDLQELQSIYKRLKWIESVDGFQGVWNLNQLKLSMEIGQKLPCHTVTLNKIKDLKKLNEFILMWEEKAQRILNAKKEKFTLEDVEYVLAEANLQPVALPSLPPLRELIMRTNVWLHKVKSCENKSEYPYIDDLETLVSKGEAFPLYLKPLNILRSQLHGTKLWKEMCARAFLKKNSCISLIEALVPRKKVLDTPIRSKRKRFDSDNPHHLLAASLLDLRLSDLKVDGEIAKAYEKSQTREVEQLVRVRKYNLDKKRTDVGDMLWCVCQKSFGQFMIRCELCCEYYHVTCVPLPVVDTGADIPEGVSPQAFTAYKISVGDIRYFGPCCSRSKRPKLDVILDLLLKLQKLPVKVIEGEAIHYLAKRAMRWMDTAKEFIGRKEVSEALRTIKATNSGTNIDVDGKTKGKQQPIRTYHFGNVPHIPFKAESQLTEVSPDSHIDDEVIDCAGSWYTVKNQTRKSFPIPKNYEEPKIRLPPFETFTVESLFVEAGLMEVYLEESLDIWRLVEAGKPKPSIDSAFGPRKVQDIIEQEVRVKQVMDATSTLSEPGTSAPIIVKQLIRKARKRKLTVKDEDIDVKKNTAQEYDEDCAANPCKQPSGKGINWVQCDGGCDLWFHIICVGVKKSQLKDLDKFKCQNCLRTTQPRGGGGVVQDVDDSSEEQDLQILCEKGKGSICSNKENDNANVEKHGLSSTVVVEESEEYCFSL